jgi:GNAT superfamily N-acetyltransferase
MPMLDRLRERPLAALASDLRCLARTQGARSALGTLGRGVAESVYAREDIHVLVKRLDDVTPISFAPRLRVAEIDTGLLPELAALNRARCDTRADHRFARNLRRRYRGFAGREDGTLAGYYWWTDSRAESHAHLDRLGIELGAADAYGFDFFLAAAHRGEGRAVEFLHHVETRLRDLGYERLWGYVAGTNTPARWLYNLRGYEVAGTRRLRRGSMR